jgi:hypothetical protein
MRVPSAELSSGSADQIGSSGVMVTSGSPDVLKNAR